MAYSPETRQKARHLFVHQRYALPAIAATLSIATATLSRWKAEARLKGDDWDVARSAAVMTGDGFDALASDAVEGFVVMFQATMDDIRDSGEIPPADKVKMMASLSDAFNKMVNAAGRAAPKLSKLGVATDVIQRLAKFVREQFPQHGDAFGEILEPFGAEIAKDYHEAK